jgi:hypothetical protein
MAKKLISASIATAQTIEAGHVSQSVKAFTGTEAYDITISGSLTTTGTNIMSSSASPSITSILTENDSFPFIQSSPTTGPNFRMDLADANSSGSAHISLGRQDGLFGGTGFLARYATGSSASQGEIIMALGKNGLLGAQEDRFIVQSEPGRIVTNGNSELTLSVGGPTTGRRQVLGNVQDGTGEFANFAAGIDNQFGRKRFVSFEYSSNSTSSQAGFFSSSLAGTGVPNFNTNAIPFGIVAGGSQTTDLTNTAFFIDRGGSVGAIVPVTASFQISRGGSIDMEGHITASGNISASGNIIGNNGSFTTSITTPEISGNTEITGDLQVVKITADGRISTTSHITASGNISSSGDLFARDITANDITLDALGISDKPNVILKRGSTTGISLEMGSGGNDNGILEVKNANGLQSIRLEGGGNSFFSQSLNVGVPYSYPEPVGGTFTVRGTISSSGAINTLSHITASGTGLFQAGKPIKTHTTSPISASLANAGRYHIVGGTLTASIVLDSTAPIGAEYEFFQTSSVGQFLFESASGTTVISKNGSLRLAQQGSSAVLKKVSTTTFHLMGDLT